MQADRPDCRVSTHGNLYLFQPLNAPARAWLDDNVAADSWQWFGQSLAIDYSYAYDVARAMVDDGLRVE